jgi:AraC family transcriptional regulator of adaptative response/methylated-DNA-[protein]-cysteine methyltransferase
VGDGSPYHFQRNFKRLVGVSPREYAEVCRLNKVRRGLQHGGDVTTAMVEAGY